MSPLACPACARSNRPHRGYCGGCGATLQPVCRGCRFVNDVADQFCGGCGSTLAERVVVAIAAPVVAPSAPVSELEDLFAPAPSARADESLPSTNVTQSDIDRMFGVSA